MSYSRKYRTSISLRGTVRADFPASEKGGSQTIHWEHTEPINIDVDVDTDPFEYSISECDQRIDLLKAAVVGMNSAQVISIHESSRKIAHHVTDGFFGMVSSEISQQIADLLNKANAKLSLMLEQKKAAINILAVMKRDYERLSGHYHDLFENLDTELKRRIHALDKKSFELSSEVMSKLLLQSTLDAGSTQMVESSDVSGLQSLLAASAVKNKVNTLIDTSRKFLADDQKLAMSLVNITDEQKTEAKLNVYMPLLIVGKKKIPENAEQIEYIFPERASAAMKAELTRRIPKQANELHWSDIEARDRENITAEYERLVNEGYANQVGEKYVRQRKLMMEFIKTNLKYVYKK